MELKIKCRVINIAPDQAEKIITIDDEQYLSDLKILIQSQYRFSPNLEPILFWDKKELTNNRRIRDIKINTSKRPLIIKI